MQTLWGNKLSPHANNMVLDYKHTISPGPLSIKKKKREKGRRYWSVAASVERAEGLEDFVEQLYGRTGCIRVTVGQVVEDS